MKNLFLLTLALMVSACTTTPREGTWIQGANKTPLFVPKKEKKECKLVMGERGAGPRATYGYITVCKKVDKDTSD
jgi:starvation-inducible outer membrane lipoprotein